MIKLCGLALICAAVSIVLREIKSSAAALVSVAGAILLFTAAAASLFPSIGFIIDAAEQSELSGYAAVLCKALGVSYSAELTADICRGSGADAAASGIELIGRAEIVLLACPLLSELLEASLSII